MEYQMGGYQKLCATCEYWIGPRQPNFLYSHVVLPNESVAGKCACYNGPHARADRLSNFTVCNCYKKWAVLK